MAEATLERWRALCRRAGASGDVDGVYRTLQASYTSDDRAYHDFGHIDTCLARFDTAKHLVDDADAVELAIWFHDAVYDTHAADNERQSADLAAKLLGSLGLEPRRIDRVHGLILATEHREEPADDEGKLIADVDLLGLADSAVAFDEAGRRIRHEYAWVDESEFQEGRRRLLARFHARPQIYYLPFFRDQYEAAARRNLKRVIEQNPG